MAQEPLDSMTLSDLNGLISRQIVNYVAIYFSNMFQLSFSQYSFESDFLGHTYSTISINMPRCYKLKIMKSWRWFTLFMLLLELRIILHKYNCMNESFGCFLFLVRGIFTENHKIRDWWQESQYSDEMDTTDKYRPWSGSATNGPLKRTPKSRTSCHSGYRLRDWCDDMATWVEIFPIS